MGPNIAGGKAVVLLFCFALLTTREDRLFAQNTNRQSSASPILILGIEGIVEVSRAGSQRWDLAYTNQVLDAGDRVRTRQDSRLTLRWSDQSRVRLGAMTEFQVDVPPVPKSQSEFSLFRGLAYFFHRDKPADVRVKTRTASAAVRGTEFNLEARDNGQTILTMIDGEVDLSNAQDGIHLRSGEQGVAEPGTAPRKTAQIAVINVIQWCLYYPGILDPDETAMTPAEQQTLADSLAAYRSGDLLQALQKYPAGRQPASPAEKVYFAALLLAVGQVEQSSSILDSLGPAAGQPDTASAAILGEALRQLIAAVKLQAWDRKRLPELATEWLAESYYQQSRAHLPEALAAAREAVKKSPDFGSGLARVAELEFSFGRSSETSAALNRSLELAPRNPQALSLKGFLLAAQNKTIEALRSFDQAIAIDPALGNAWLGRGLTRIRRGDMQAGREDLLVAASVEPQRSLLRSYLGKAYAETGDDARAEKELALAKQFDPADPTAWLYSALAKEQQSRINEAIDDLEKSQELNENRQLFRSRLLLDQDRAVRNANLARLYADAGLEEVAVREASQAVAADYANSSAHLFLANSYELARRANPSDLRFETVAFNEYLLASLMGPADGRLLAQPVSQQEYTRLFEHDYFGLSTSTEYLSRGAWNQYGAQYGTFRNSSYALEADYRWDPGETPNREIETRFFSAKFKQMVTPKDGLFVQVLDFWQENEDITQRYDPASSVAGVRTRTKQEPDVLAGLDHQWNEANRTLFLFSHLDASVRHSDPHGSTYLLQEIFGTPFGLVRTDLTQEYEDRITVDSFELQHLIRISKFQTIAGIRFQDSIHRLSNLQTINVGNAVGHEIYFALLPGTVITDQTSLRLYATRLSPYIYEHVQIAESLWLIGGISYDYQEQPRNLLFAPVSDEQDFKDQYSPKAGLVWTPGAHSAVRAAYTRSFGGVSLDQSVRLEPSQVAGFVQGYRNVIPAALTGGIDASRVDTADLSLEHRFPTRTYLALAGQFLRSAIEHDVGGFQRDLFTSSGPAIQLEEELRYQERSLEASANQLLADWFSVGLRYRLSEARLKRAFPELDPALAGNNNERTRGILHTLSIQNLFRHPSGFYAGAEALWWSQELAGNLSSLDEDDFWQGNLFAGYRSPRRHVEVTVGLLNITGQDYRIHPINLYADLARERTFFARLQLNF